MVTKISNGFLVLGIFIGLISILADVIGLGSGGIQSAQLLGVQVGILLALVGFGIKILAHDKKQMYSWEQVRLLGERVLSQPVIVWVLISFLVVYFLFFISPVFLNEKLQMAYLNRYLPHTGMIGADLRVFVERIEGWLNLGRSPYVTGYIAYPPFSFFVFSPLVLIGYPGTFRFITMMTLLSYLVVTLIIPILITKGKSLSIILFVFIIGLFSYGLQFELERGQSNLIAFAACMSGIYLFHFHKRFRFFAYLLFSLSVQLKLYPAIFILLLVDNWRDWKGNLKRILGLAFFNFALLFVMGYAAFIEFAKAVALQQFNLSQWNGNHSIRAFAVNLTSHGFGLFSPEATLVLGRYTKLIEITLMGILGICIVLVVYSMYHRKAGGFNPYLLLVCMIGALVIPSVSNDYKLSILPASVAIALSGLTFFGTPMKKGFAILLVLLFSAAYWSVLYPFKVKPEILSSSFPVLLVMLISGSILYFLCGTTYPTENDQAQ